MDNPYQKLDTLKHRLDAHRPLATEVVENLRANVINDWTYHSNAIEGNTLSRKETRVVLEGVTVGGKTLREHLEATNHREAIYCVEQMVAEDAPLSEVGIKTIHRLVLRGIDDSNAGVYRTTPIAVVGAEYQFCGPAQVPGEMQKLLEWYGRAAQTLHPVERAARVHADFVKVHPFVDGNGRTSRLLMNLELMKSGFPPAIISVAERLEYYRALDIAHTQNAYERFLGLVARAVEAAFEPYWRAVGADTKT